MNRGFCMGIVFTSHCVLCGRRLPATDKAFLCHDCASGLWQYRLKNTSVNIKGADGAVAALSYRNAVRYAMIKFKFRSRQSYAEWFSAQLLPLVADKLEEWKPDLVTFPPLSLLRYWKRGYNQAELIAKPIAESTGVPCVATLRKQPFKGRQSRRKNADARWKNAKNMFKPLKDMNLGGKRVLLIDDIITTGATAASAARVIRDMGAEYVYIAAPTKT